jgi:hypothetical protein
VVSVVKTEGMLIGVPEFHREKRAKSPIGIFDFKVASQFGTEKMSCPPV